MEKAYRVYRYTFQDGKVYVGMTSVTLQERRDFGYAHNKGLKEAIRKCGWRAIEKEIVFTSNSQEEAFNAEIAEIERLGSTDPSVGYNISHGGKSTFAGLKHTDSYKKHMSDMCMGRTFSKETIERMVEAHRKERKAVLMVDGDGSAIMHLCSLAEAAKLVGGYASNVSRACESGKPYKGFYWRFADERG